MAKKNNKKKWNELFEAHKKDNHLTAIELARQFLKKSPNDSSARIILGRSLAAIGRYDEGLALLKGSIKEVPEDKEFYPYLVIGEFYMLERKNYKLAEKWFLKSLEKDPKSSPALEGLGIALKMQGRIRDAKMAFRKAIKVRTDPQDEPYYNLGECFLFEGDYNQAIKCYDKAIEIDPKYELALKRKEDVRQAQKVRLDFKIATPNAPPKKKKNPQKDWFEKPNLMPENKYEELFKLTIQNQFVTAIEVANQCLKEYPNDPFVLVILSRSLVEIERFGDALSVLKKSIKPLSKKRRSGAWRSIGRLYERKGNYKRAEIWLRRALDKKPDNAYTLIWLGSVVLAQGRSKEAKKFLRKATRVESNICDKAYYYLGNCLLVEEDYHEAIECYARALEINPLHREASLRKKDAANALKLRLGLKVVRPKSVMKDSGNPDMVGSVDPNITRSH